MHNIINYLNVANNIRVNNLQTAFVVHAFLTYKFRLRFNSLHNNCLNTVQLKSHLNLIQKSNLNFVFTKNSQLR